MGYWRLVSMELSLLFFVHLDVHKLTLIASLIGERRKLTLEGGLGADVIILYICSSISGTYYNIKFTLVTND